MKKILIAGLSVLLLCLSVFCLVACTDGPAPVVAEKIVFSVEETGVKVIFIDAENNSETAYDGAYSAEYLDDLIYFLAGKEVLEAESSSSQYGSFFTKIGSLSQSDNNYLYFYTNLDEYKDVTDYALTETYNDLTLTSVSLGASSLPVKAGAVYMVTLVSF